MREPLVRMLIHGLNAVLQGTVTTSPHSSASRPRRCTSSGRRRCPPSKCKIRRRLVADDRICTSSFLSRGRR